MEWIIAALFLIGVLGIGAWIAEGPIGQRWRRWRASRQADIVENAQTTSERGLGGGWWTP